MVNYRMDVKRAQRTVNVSANSSKTAQNEFYHIISVFS